VPDAPSTPNVLAQEDDDGTDYRFPVAVEDSLSFGDASVSVRCKPVRGRVDQACGIVWRYRDENNYYLARANALEDNVRFYYVENGRRHEVRGREAFLSLSDYLRRSHGLIGTKIVCSEGDCGACSVLIGRLAAEGSRLVCASHSNQALRPAAV